ncbi:MAG: lipoprotein [Gammaproteobacteria bacterium]|nr:lipoprotein [Gammaproteobacteria bacterium]
MKRIIALIVLNLFLSACGQKGDLYIEKTTFSFNKPKVNNFYNANIK